MWEMRGRGRVHNLIFYFYTLILILTMKAGKQKTIISLQVGSLLLRITEVICK
jgi:hypothetical protein